jgi:hypothetical protein
VIVSRHPNAKPEGASAFPQQWSIHDGRTYDLLRQGPPVVVQQSSGVAVEAMQLGIPVIEMQFPGRPPTYPVIREPPVRFASSSQELKDAVAASHADGRDPAFRQRLIGWARGWSWPTGLEAGERMVVLVERALADGPRGAIWPPWR